MTRALTDDEKAKIAVLAYQRTPAEVLGPLFPGRSIHSIHSALTKYRRAHRISLSRGRTGMTSGAATDEARRRASEAIPPPRGYSAEEIAWAEQNAPEEDEQALLVLAHLGHDMRLPGKPPSTEMRL